VNKNISFGEFWTSGSDEGCNGKFTWCSAGKVFRNMSWISGFAPDKDYTKHCVALSLPPQSQVGIFKADCAQKMTFICEVNFQL